MLWTCAVVFWAVFTWSAVAPYDRFTWWLEVIPALVAFGVLAVFWKRLRPTPLLLGLILLHTIILMVGGHYTYALVPGFEFDLPFLGGMRNHFDKIGHFAQGFVPAMVAREIMVRLRIVRGGGWRAFLIVCVCLAISAFYELIEWWVAVGTGEAAEAFLGTQGYAWDTQSDMCTALVGACVALVALSRWHDRQIVGLKRSEEGAET